MNVVVRRNFWMRDDGVFWNTVLVFVLRFIYNEFKLFKRAALLCNGNRCEDFYVSSVNTNVSLIFRNI